MVEVTATSTVTPEPTNRNEPTETPTPEPTPTSTPVPLADLLLEPLLIQSGDLPPGCSGSQVRAEVPHSLRNGPVSQNSIRQILVKNGQTGGSASVPLFESLEDVEAALDLAAEDLPDVEAVNDFDEAAHLGIFSVMNMSPASFAISRRHAVVQGQFIGTTDAYAALSYAKRLEARLEPLVCRDEGAAAPVGTSSVADALTPTQKPRSTQEPTHTPRPTPSSQREAVVRAGTARWSAVSPPARRSACIDIGYRRQKWN